MDEFYYSSMDETPEILEQRALTNIAYELRLQSRAAWRAYQEELDKLYELTRDHNA
jgi:hypothetical protein